MSDADKLKSMIEKAVGHRQRCSKQVTIPVKDIGSISLFPDDYGATNIVPVWVSSAALEDIWKKDLGDYVDRWVGDPKSRWFIDSETPNGIRLPLISVIFQENEVQISFSQGRHRTRWMISNLGLARIPVGMSSDMADRASGIGLVVAQVLESENLSHGI